ncbi:MAG: DUF4339 domain-containing protein [Pseudomonadota bacterium]
MQRRKVLFGGFACLLPAGLKASTPGIFIAENGAILGPFDATALKERIKSVADAQNVMVWHQGMTDWAPATQAPALAEFIATLPAKTPFDFASYVIGTWLCTDFEYKTEHEHREVTLIGRKQLSFDNEGTYSGYDYAEYINQKWVPTQDPGEMKYTEESFYVNDRLSGNYVVKPIDQDGIFDVYFDGKAKSGSGKVKPEKFSFTFIVKGPDLMESTAYEVFRREV